VVVDEHHPNAVHCSRSLAGRQTLEHDSNPVLRPYVDADWEAVVGLCLLAFAPACESLERSAGVELGWRAGITRHLRSLTRPAERERLVVAELRGSIVGVVHYEVDRDARSASFGVSAVHPARQGVASSMFDHVLGVMGAQGVKYVTADVGADACHAAVRRAYEKAGFVAVPTVHYYAKLPGPGAGVARRSPGRTRRGAGSGGGRSFRAPSAPRDRG
jgi:ribosomal protein S18 acetylase RimI-like enzyme